MAEELVTVGAFEKLFKSVVELVGAENEVMVGNHATYRQEGLAHVV